MAGKKRAKKQTLIRTSERTSFKRCRWAWAQAYVHGLKPKTEAPALRFGTLIHKAMELRYPPGRKRGPHPAKTFERVYQEELDQQREDFGFRDEDGEWHNALELGIDMLNGYVDKYGKDEEWKVLAAEQAFQVPVFDDDGKHLFTYVGTFDGVWQHLPTKEIHLRDYKTAKSIDTGYLTLDEQAGSYWAYGPEWLRATGQLKEDQELAGITFDFLRKAMRDTRPKNDEGYYLNKPKKPDIIAEYERLGRDLPRDKRVEALVAGLGGEDKVAQLGEISKEQPPPLLHREKVYRDESDSHNLRERVKQEAREMRLIRKGKLAVYKNPGKMTCGGCGFRDMCELHEVDANWELLRDQTMTSWDGYSAHELEGAR